MPHYDAHEACRRAKRLMTRFVTAGGGPADRDRAIRLFEDAADSGALPPDEEVLARTALGVLLMLRALPAPLHPDPGGAATLAFGALLHGAGGLDAEAIGDGLRAVEQFQRVLDHQPIHPELHATAQTSLIAVQLVLAMNGAGPLPTIPSLPPSPTSTMLMGMQAWLSDDGTDPAVREAIEAMIAQLPAGNAVRGALTGELATLASGTRRPDDLRAARDALRAELAAAGPAAPDDLRRKLAGVSVTLAASGDPVPVDQLVDEADALLAAAPPGSLQRGRDHFLRAMALMLRARRDSAPDDARAAVRDLEEALRLLPVDDDLAPVVVATLGALLHDRHALGGVGEDQDAAAYLLDRAMAVARAHPDSPDLAEIQALGALNRAVAALRGRDRAAVAAVADELRDLVPPGHPWRPRLDVVRGLALVVGGDDAGLALLDAAATAEVIPSSRPALAAAGAVALLLRAAHTTDLAAADEALRRLRAISSSAPDERAGLVALEGLAELLRAERGAGRAALDAAVDRLTAASDELGGDPGGPPRTLVLTRLADAHWQRGDTADALRVGLAALRAAGAEALLQTRTAHALASTREVAGQGERLARRCLSADRPDLAVRAVELGRGLVLHAATSAAKLPALLRAHGHEALADEWVAVDPDVPPPWTDPAAALADVLLPGPAPTDLRRRALEALLTAGPDLLAPPDAAEIGGALDRIGADALAYLVAGGPAGDGLILLVDRAGRVTPRHCPHLRAMPGSRVDPAPAVRGPRELAVSPAAATWLDGICDWAWDAAVAELHTAVARPGREPRVVLVPVGALGAVPWHAARRPVPGGHRYAVADLELSYAASARQLVEVARRPVAPLAAGQVLVGDPTRELPGAATEVRTLHETFYPAATVLGGDDGTPTAVLERHGAALLHLACHAYAGGSPDESFLRLAGGARLPVERVLRRAERRSPDSPGGLVVLSACVTGIAHSAYDEALSLATAFLAAGAAGVVGSLWAVPDDTTPHLMHVFHHFLAKGATPAAALRAAQLWMLDPHRPYVPGMPLPPDEPTRLADPAGWAAFIHHGR
ncbi:CHAT domain-containing protein [Asanoa siamensis]|uniref:CHAT domain-containing protein n=1 Tax=Asanoa siamensis TaxID=926357 RepID=A0ABQ4CRJ0_9ACTN|nr:CHAT domain-containing protein [Asanoa siamensis]GIF73918.1 hypothetical protein Asi02nite_34360 [Asanoa siamensis]